MLPNVDASDMVPSKSSHPHGPPLLGRVRVPSRSPTSPLVCSPPTPSSPSVAAPVPLASDLPRCGCCSWPPAGAPQTRRRRRRVTGSPWSGVFRGRTRASQVPGPSSFVRAVVQDPAGCDSSSPVLHGEAPVAFRLFDTLGTRNDMIFVATYPRPTRSRAYASPVPLPAPSQGSLPARAASPLAGRDLHPQDDERSFMEASHPPFLFDQPCLVASWYTSPFIYHCVIWRE